jgi:hypothetical protein
METFLNGLETRFICLKAFISGMILLRIPSLIAIWRRKKKWCNNQLKLLLRILRMKNYWRLSLRKCSFSGKQLGRPSVTLTKKKVAILHQTNFDFTSNTGAFRLLMSSLNSFSESLMTITMEKFLTRTFRRQLALKSIQQKDFTSDKTRKWTK